MEQVILKADKVSKKFGVTFPKGKLLNYSTSLQSVEHPTMKNIWIKVTNRDIETKLAVDVKYTALGYVLGIVDVKYTALGHVLGILWGDTKTSAYPSKRISADNYTDLMNQCKNELNNGSLDSGMGFQSLTGAILNVSTYKTIHFGGKPFTNVEVERITIGEVTEAEKEFVIF